MNEWLCPPFPHPRQYLAQQLAAANWGGKSYTELCEISVKKLESDYGNCLRAVVNKA